MQPQTQKQYYLGNPFIADNAIAILFEAGMFNALYKPYIDLVRITIDKAEKLLKKGVTVVEGNKPLSEVYNDSD